VGHDDGGVPGAVEVDLDQVGALLDGQLVGGQRVLGTVPRSAAVGDHEGPASAHAQPRERSTARRQPA
jgi:hypothetical protein